MAAIAHKYGLNDSMLAGAGAGLVSSIATCPLDVIKTKLQAQKPVRGSAEYQGVVDTVKTILRQDGLRGLYRGLGPTILGYLPTWAIYFTVYDGAKSWFGEESSSSSSSSGGKNGKPRIYPAPHAKGYSHHHPQDHHWRNHILSAMTAGATSTVATNPLWVIKTRFMTQAVGERRYRHTVDAIRQIYTHEGPAAFYRGLLPSLLGIAHVAIQFPLYEQFKTWATPQDGPLPTAGILLCSGTSKMFASVATYPHEVVRTQLQIQKRTRAVAAAAGSSPTIHLGLVGTVRELLHADGWRGLYKGLSVNLIRTVPNSAVTMLTYELLMRTLHDSHDNEHH